MQQPPTLTKNLALRYARQILLPGIDLEGQESLMAAKVLIIGAGGLGCAAAQYVVRVGGCCIVLIWLIRLSKLQLFYTVTLSF